jgi:hypothetical protein
MLTHASALYLILLLNCFVKIHALTGCQLCAQTGKCDKAYHSGPGQFCGYFQESGFVSKPCCCPLNSICKLSPFQCLCHIPDRGWDFFDYGNHSTQFEDDAASGFFIFLVILLLCLCCCCGSCSSNSNRRHQILSDREDSVPIAIPVSSSEVPYGSVHSNRPPPASAPPLISSDPRQTRSFDDRPYTRSNGAGGAGSSGIVPALGGFLVGEMLGQALGARREEHRHYRHNGRHFAAGGGGGFDIRGDTGGLDFVGDSGTNGIDIAGDS